MYGIPMRHLLQRWDGRSRARRRNVCHIFMIQICIHLLWNIYTVGGALYTTIPKGNCIGKVLCTLPFENDVKMYGTQTSVCHSVTPLSFENDVKMYGTQTEQESSHLPPQFENDVKMYGTQTSMMHSCTELGFENDVKMYGTQTNTVTIGQTRRLRMM